ncbi:MAG: hypothetical protein AAFR04_12565 [Pseudomonadota bacterium]
MKMRRTLRAMVGPKTRPASPLTGMKARWYQFNAALETHIRAAPTKQGDPAGMATGHGDHVDAIDAALRLSTIVSKNIATGA